jgi:hypothetical protein
VTVVLLASVVRIECWMDFIVTLCSFIESPASSLSRVTCGLGAGEVLDVFVIASAQSLPTCLPYTEHLP